MLIDLQLHSTYSDGYLTPFELVKFLSKYGVKTASLTDHNTVAGLYEFKQACQKYKIKPITGLELYVKFNNRKLNVLWYNFDFTREELYKMLHNSYITRRSNLRRALEKLIKYGFKIEINRVLDKYNNYIPINRIIDDIRNLRYNQVKIKRELGTDNPREEEIIKKYFYNKDICVLHNTRIDIRRIIELRERIGGKIILSHPCKYKYPLRGFFKTLRVLGIDGIEVFSPHHSIGSVMYLQYVAKESKFIETGGSDFHRYEGGNNLIQNSWQYYKIDSNYLTRIKEIIG